MNIRFYNAKILTMSENTAVFDGEVWIKEDRIILAGTNQEVSLFYEKNPYFKITWDREIDVHGNLLMPGFKNAHTHSGMTFLRSFADDLPLLEWLNQMIFPMEKKITEEDIYLFAKLAILEYLTSGITAIGDMYLAPDAMAAASRDYGFRTVLIGAINDFTHSVKQMEDWYQKFNQQDDLVSYQLGFHAEYTTSIEILKDIAGLSAQYKAPVSFHISETREEVEQCRIRNGVSPAVYLEQAGVMKNGGCGYHCVHMSEEDMDIFKRNGFSAVTNPGSNVKLASGIADIPSFISKGINVAVGTDGPASNNCLDMFREMFLVTGLAKLKTKDASSVDADSVLRMAILGSAKALYLDECDMLTAGKKADMIMIDLQQPNMQPIHNITKNIVYSGSKANVKMTMIDGKILYENGIFHVGEDPITLYEKVNQTVGRLKRS